MTQTFEDFELIICDNASTDGTGQIARDYAARDPRVRYVRHERNIGATANYRRVFDLSSAPYFRWAAADDLFAPESIARCVEVLDREPGVVLTYPKTKFIDDRGRVISDCDDGLHLQSPDPAERFRRLVVSVGYVNALFGLMRSNVVRETRLAGDYLGSDAVLLGELALRGTFWEIPEFLFFRRMHSGAFSSMTIPEKQAYYRPDRRSLVHMREWRHLWENLRSVMRAPLSTFERGRLVNFLMRRAISVRPALLHELGQATKQLAGRLVFHGDDSSTKTQSS